MLMMLAVFCQKRIISITNNNMYRSIMKASILKCENSKWQHSASIVNRLLQFILFIVCKLIRIIQANQVGFPITGLTQSHLCTCLKPGSTFPT